VASLLALLALLTLVVKSIVEWNTGQHLAEQSTASEETLQ